MVSRKGWPVIGAEELRLSNGMRVVFKKTDFLLDQVLMSGFAFGGLSEEDPRDYPSAMCASMVASEVGQFGLRPDVLSEVLAGARVAVGPDLQAYWRTFGGDQSPDHLEVALQMVHLLFTQEPGLADGDEELIRRMTVDSIRSQQRDPVQRFLRAVKSLNYGDCYYTKALTERSFRRTDLRAACATFGRAFSNPAEWTVVFVGAIDVGTAEPLVRKWLGGIPSRTDPAPIPVKAIKQIPWGFPARPTAITVRAPMAEAFSTAQITWPVELSTSSSLLLEGSAGAATDPSVDTQSVSVSIIEEHILLHTCVRVLESRLLKLLRFRFGEIYSVSATSFFGMEAPSRDGPLRGDVAARFSCDPEEAPRLVRGGRAGRRCPLGGPLAEPAHKRRPSVCILSRIPVCPRRVSRGLLTHLAQFALSSVPQIKLALEELARLQGEGPDAADVAAALEVDIRAHELARQENSFWLERLVQGFKSRRFEGDVDRCHAALDATRARVCAHPDAGYPRICPPRYPLHCTGDDPEALAG